MKTIVRLLLLNLVPALWLLLIVTSASQNARAQPVHWLALPLAIALAYGALSSTFALGRFRMAAVPLALSLLALAASIPGDETDRSTAAYAVWFAAFAGAVVSVWFRPNVPWPLTGNVAVALVHVLMIVPLVVLLITFIGSMAIGG